jgi:hypothetical protein
MASIRLFRALPALLCATGLTGCLTVFSKTEVIRSDEHRPSVQFESAKTAAVFYDEMDRRSRVVGGACLGVPFITIYAKETVVSENAFFGDQVRECDTNHDGLITELEARIYARSHVGRVDEGTPSVKIEPAPVPAQVTAASHVREAEPAQPVAEGTAAPAPR